MNDIQIFNNPQFGDIRTAGTPEEPLFCAVDVARALGYARPADAVTAHCKGVSILPTPTNGGIQQVKFIKESEVYRLIFKSNAPNAEAFNSWVAEDVLPSIRKKGSYSVATLSRKELAMMVIKAEEEKEQLALENKRQAEKIKQDAPKVEHHDLFMNAEHGEKCVSIRKFISQAGIIKEGKFWSWMEHEKKMIYRDKHNKPVPYAEFRYLFMFPDRHNEKTNWSGTQLMIGPETKAQLTKMYYEAHPENFLDNSNIKQLNIWQ